jgi:FixJ family two-component response regulator
MKVPSANFYIVDDDISFGKSLKRLLNVRGLYADHFRSAQSFLDSVHPGQWGYAIVDIHMPDCDGFELMAKMHEMGYIMPVIVITGQPQSDSRDLALEKGALGFLQKPFGDESLLEIVDNHKTNNSH